RSMPETADVPVIAFASHVNRAAIDDARTAGATRVLARSAYERELPALLGGPPASKGPGAARHDAKRPAGPSWPAGRHGRPLESTRRPLPPSACSRCSTGRVAAHRAARS